MPLALAMLRTVVLVAGLSLAGRWLIGLMAGSARDGNAVYQLLSIVASPALKLARLLLPRRASERHAALLAGFIAAATYFGVGLWERDLCLRDLAQAGCANWAVARGQRGS
jgi:hypothetical protein